MEITEACSYLCGSIATKLSIQNTHTMSKTYFTPTHKNGRRLSKADRKAANQAKWAKMQAKTPTKAKLNPRKLEAVAEVFDFSYIDACARTYTPLPEEKSKPKAKRKSKAKHNSKRVNRNDKLEAQAQRLSRGTAGTNPAPVNEPKAMATSIPSADMEIYDLCNGDPVAAARHAAYMTNTDTEDVVFEDVL